MPDMRRAYRRPRRGLTMDPDEYESIATTRTLAILTGPFLLFGFALGWIAKSLT